MLKKIKISQKKTCIICDIDRKSGLGHLNRMMVLYRELQKQKLNPYFFFNKKNCYFIKKYITGVKKFIVSNEIYKKNHNVIDFLKKKRIDVVILDSYRIDKKFEKKLSFFFLTVAIDDHQKKHLTHLVFNNRQDIKTSLIKNNNDIQWYSGKKYLLFNEVKKKKTLSKTKINKILVHAGGSDAYLNNKKFFETLFFFIKNLNIKVDLLCVKKDTKQKLIKNYFKDFNKKKLNYVFYNKNLRETFCNYDLIVGPAGNITFEAISARTLTLSFPFVNDGRDSILTWNMLGNFLHLTSKECKNKKLILKILSLIFKNYNIFNRKFFGLSKGIISGEKKIVKIIKLNLQNGNKYSFKKNKDKILIKKTNFSHARAFLIGRNQKKARLVSSNPDHIITWPEHINWWSNKNIKKFVITKGNLNLAFHWVKKYYSHELRKDITISGWFPFNDKDNNNLKYSKMILDHQVNYIKNMHFSSLWIVIANKKNLITLRMNKSVGFSAANTQVKNLAKKIFKISLSKFNVFQMQI